MCLMKVKHSVFSACELGVLSGRSTHNNNKYIKTETHSEKKTGTDKQQIFYSYNLIMFIINCK